MELPKTTQTSFESQKDYNWGGMELFGLQLRPTYTK